MPTLMSLYLALLGSSCPSAAFEKLYGHQLLYHVSFSSTDDCHLKSVQAATLLNALLTLLNESTECSTLLSLLGFICPSVASKKSNLNLCLFILSLPMSTAQSKMPTSMSLYLALLGSTYPSAAFEKPHLNTCLQFYNAVNVHFAFALSLARLRRLL
jgi:hypothetical protein